MPIPNTEALNALLQEWQQAKTATTQWGERERQLRDKIAQAVFGYDKTVGGMDGTFRHDLGGNYKLKLLAPVTYKLKAGAELHKAIEYVRDLPYALPKPLVTWDPKLDVRVYKAAADDVKAVIAPALTTTPGAPQLEIEGLV